jgi:MFS family permease
MLSAFSEEFLTVLHTDLGYVCFQPHNQHMFVCRTSDRRLTRFKMLIELPAAMSLRYFQPRYVFGLALIAFGIFAAVIPPARSYGAIMALRVLIGLGEAFTTNAFIFVSLWYKPEELATRIGETY